jgi:hypothetical protein
MADSQTQAFLDEFGINAKELLTDDISVQVEFMDALQSMAQEYLLFSSEDQHRLKHSKYIRPNTSLHQNTLEIMARLHKLAEYLKSLCTIKLEKSSMLVLGNIQRAQDKREIMLRATTEMVALCAFMKEISRKLRVRNCQIRLLKNEPTDKQIRLSCKLGYGESWVNAIDLIISSDKDMYPLDALQLLSAATLIEDTNAIPLKALLAEVGLLEISSQDLLAARLQLTEYLPCLIVSKSGRHVVVNLHELAIEADGNTFANIILLDREQMLSTTTENNDNSEATPPVHEDVQPANIFVPKKRGPVPKYIKFPEIVQWACPGKRACPGKQA